MGIIMAVAGVIVGAIIGGHIQWRSDVAKNRHHLESKTPYDHALTNAINDRDRLQDELITIQALKRTEADTERIRNEIDTILSDDVKEATEGVYDVDEAFMDSTDLTFRQYYDVIKTPDGMSTEEAAWDAGAVARAYQANVREVEHVVKSGETLSQIARKYGVKVWGIVEDNELLVYDNLDGIGVICVGQRLRIRDNVCEDERLAKDDVERSLINDIKDKASENLELAVEFAKMTVQDDEAIRKQLEETSKELSEETRELRRGIREFREEGKYYGETLYRRGGEHNVHRI